MDKSHRLDKWGRRKPHIYKSLGEYVVRFNWQTMLWEDISAACVYAINTNRKLKNG